MDKLQEQVTPVLVRAVLRRCPKCNEVRRFLGRKCRMCRESIPAELLADFLPLDSIRCRRCRRLVAASVEGLCGICSVLKEFRDRIRAGLNLSRDDLHELSYTDSRMKAMVLSMKAGKHGACALDS